MGRWIQTTVMMTIVAATTIMGGCEDAAPTEYIPETIVEAFLVVGEPIRGIRVTRSQSLIDTFRYASSAVPDADVRLVSGDITYALEYRADSSVGEYFLRDSSVRVEPQRNYKLIVTTKDGKVVTGETRTPAQIAWIDEPDALLQYPIDSLNVNDPPDSLSLSWTPIAGVSEYLISVQCLDTVEYGRYLEPSTSEKNRRIVRFFESGLPRYDETIRIGFLQATRSPMVWFAFKWFGRHVVSVYATDQAYINWYKMTYWQNPASYQPLLDNVEGGLGVVASASVARKEVFVLKNQP